MPKSARWIRISMVIVCAALSVVPECFPLFIPPSAVGIQSYCNYREAPSTKLFVFKWFTCYVWVLLATIVGIVSMAITLVTIARRSNDVIVEAGLSDSTLYMEQRRHRTSVLVVRTLKSVVWFPVIPIVALGFTTAYSIVQYKTGRRTHAMDVADQVLQFLQVPFMAMTFYASPPVRRAFSEWRDGGDKFGRRAAVPLELVPGEMESRLSRMELHTFVR
ncbi:hypothetical protein EC988_006873 [Linderina pennispora]|nr:hypothetical protein EC988_006873 [Linderina pennispora]